MGDAEEYKSSYGLLLVQLDQKHGCKHAICASFQDPFLGVPLQKEEKHGKGRCFFLSFSSLLSLLLVILWDKGKEYS